MAAEKRSPLAMEVRASLVLGCSVILAVVGGAAFFKSKHQLEIAAATKVPAVETQATTKVEEPRTAPWTGVIVARDSIGVAPRLAGRVEVVNVRIGDTVKAKTVIARLDDRILRAELRIAQAGVTTAAANQMRAAKQHEAAQQIVKHNKSLGRDLVSGQELIRSEYDEKVAALNVRVAESDAARAVSVLHEATESAADAEIRAPFDGVVAARYVDPGGMVAAGSPIIRLQRSNALSIRFAVPPTAMAGLAPGVRVLARADSVDRDLIASIERISPEIDSNSRLIVVEAKLSDESAKLVADGDVAHVSLAAHVSTR